MNKILSLALATVILGGCGTLEKRASAVRPGDSREAVTRAMGPPHDSQFKGNQEAWQYCRSSFGYYDYRTFWFEDGVLSGVTSRKQKPHMGELSCKGRFESVRWEDAPDATIEVRNR